MNHENLLLRKHLECTCWEMLNMTDSPTLFVASCVSPHIWIESAGKKVKAKELTGALRATGRQSKQIFLLLFRSIRKCLKLPGADKLQSRHVLVLPTQEISSSRRRIVFSGGALLVAITPFNCGLTPSLAKAEENDSKDQDDEGEKGLVGAITSLFDPDEKTKSGKVLPKAYLKSAREVVKTLRDSLKEDPKDNAKFRRTADAAKESIREYMNDWRGQKNLAAEESYIALFKAIRSLASFYSKAGPSAPLPVEVKSSILEDLDTAEAYL